jgi:hypothetical protein
MDGWLGGLTSEIRPGQVLILSAFSKINKKCGSKYYDFKNNN